LILNTQQAFDPLKAIATQRITKTEIKALITITTLTTLLLNVWPMATVNAQTFAITGEVRDVDGERLPGAVIAAGTHGAVAGTDGRYRLSLPPGRHGMEVRYTGYVPLRTELVVQSDTFVVLTLEPEVLELPEVFITADGRDPAYGIIRRAVENKKQNRYPAPEYTYRAYTRTRIDLMEKSGLVAKSADNLEEGILYLAENHSTVAVREPAKIKEHIRASRVSGDSKQYSLFGNLFLRFSVYTNFVELEGLSDRGFISPISDNALFYYDYKLEGVAKQKPHSVYKIKVIPKRRHDPVFAGHLWIRDSTYAVAGLDLNLTSERQLQQIDSLRVAQHYSTQGTVASVRFDVTGKILGLRFGGYSASALSDYDLSPRLGEKYFNSEVMAVADTAVRVREGFWEKRPIALDSLEEKDFYEKSLLEKRKQDPAYLDSLNKANNRFKTTDLIFGYTYLDVRNDRSWYVQSPLNAVGFNTVEGYFVELTGGYFHPTGKKWSVQWETSARYGFSSQTWGLKTAAAMRKGRRRGPFTGADEYLRISGGRYVEPFGGRQIGASVNTLYTLLLKENFLKLFQRTFGEIRGQKELFNGFFMGLSLGPEQRRSMENHDLRVWVRVPDKEYTDNIAIENHTALLTEAWITFKPGVKYISTPEGKLSGASRFPILGLRYQKGFLMQKGVNDYFDRLVASTTYSQKFGLLGTTEISLSAGTLWRRAPILHFNDYHHFLANRTIFADPGLERFHAMNYYVRSSDASFFAAHWEHRFNGLLFNKIPGVRKLKWQEVAGAHCLLATAQRGYVEISAGLENIFRILRVDFRYALAGADANFRRYNVTFGVEFNSR
jgi:hypothetical protein